MLIGPTVDLIRFSRLQPSIFMHLRQDTANRFSRHTWAAIKLTAKDGAR